MTNPTCASCPDMRHCINGLYCLKERTYVQYAEQPICKPSNE